MGSTLSDLSAAVAATLRHNPSSGRRVAAPAKLIVPPAVYRAGGVAAAVSLAVSSAAYAAVHTEGEGNGLPGRSNAAIGLHGLEAANGDQADSPASKEVSYTLVVDGETRALKTSASTWGKALVAAGVSVDKSAGDTVSVPLSQAPFQGATVTVFHAGTTTEAEDTTDSHGTVEKQTDTLAKGEKKVETKGVDGVSRTTYRVTSVGGEQVSRAPVSTTQVSQKVDEVVLVGTGTPEDVAVAQAGDGTSASSAQAIAKAMMASHGWGDGEFSCLVNLWNRESNWNFQAENPSSGAYGIPQSLPGSKMASVGSDWRTNPTTQIKWGLGYIAGRYGTPCSAWAHSNATGWY